jgi:hypothetical protein
LDGLIFVLRQGGLTELGKETVQTLKGDGLRGCDLDADRLTAAAVVDHEQAVWRRYSLRALLARGV